MCFWRHKFTKWKTIKEGILGEQLMWLGRKIGEARVTGRYVEQERTCKDCGVIQLRTEETSL
jgi:hypothetical protein